MYGNITSRIPLTTNFNRKMPLTRKTYWPSQLMVDVLSLSAELKFIGWVWAKSFLTVTGPPQLHFWIIWWVLWAAIVGNFLLTFPPLWQVWLHAPGASLPPDAIFSCMFNFIGVVLSIQSRFYNIVKALSVVLSRSAIWPSLTILPFVVKSLRTSLKPTFSLSSRRIEATWRCRVSSWYL